MQRVSVTFLMLCVLLMSTTAAAAGTEGHKLPWDDFLYRIITFSGVIAVIGYFFGRKILTFFKDRTASIAQDISVLEAQKASAQQHLHDVEQRIANLEAERQAILEDYRIQGEALKASIIADAEKTASALSKQAKLTAQNEIEHAVETMRAEMADRIIEAMEKQLAKKLTAEEHAKLVDKYLTKVVLN